MGYMCSLESLSSVRLPYRWRTVRVWAPYGPLRMPYGLMNTRNCSRGVVRVSKRPYVVHKSHTVVLKAEPYGAARTESLRARTWFIDLCPVWDPIGNPHDPVRLSTSLLWSRNRRKPVSESFASSTFSYVLYGAHMGLKSCGLLHVTKAFG